MVRSVLSRGPGPAGALEASDGERAVAAGALVVALLSDDEPVCSNHGPSEPLRCQPAERNCPILWIDRTAQ